MDSPPPVRALDAFGIVTIVVFACVSVVCITPLYIPLPLAASRVLRHTYARAAGALGIDADRPASLNVAVGLKELADGDLAEEAEAHSPPPTERLYIPITHTSAPVIGVIILLATTSIGGEELRRGIVGADGVRPYDVLALFICLAYIAISLDATGLLRYLACLVCQKASFDGRVFYSVLYLFLWIAGVVLGNDPVILSGTAFLVYITRTAGISPPSAWIWAEFVAANIASAVLVSSNPTNLVIATGFDVSFVTYTAYMVLPSLAGAAFALLALMAFFSATTPRSSSAYIPRDITKPEIEARILLIDPLGAIFSGVVMLAVIGTLIGTSVTSNVEVYQIGVPGAVLCLVRDAIADIYVYRRTVPETRPTRGLQRVGAAIRWVVRAFPTATATLRKLPVALLPFAFGMFILVQALAHVGFVSIMARGLARVCMHGVVPTTFFMAFLSIVLCNFGGTNIGSTILLTKVMQDPAFTLAIAPELRGGVVRAGMYATALGSNLGALGGTFAASLAGLLWRGTLLHHGIHVRALEFATWCAITVVPAAGAALGVLLAEVIYFSV